MCNHRSRWLIGERSVRDAEKDAAKFPVFLVGAGLYRDGRGRLAPGHPGTGPQPPRGGGSPPSGAAFRLRPPAAGGLAVGLRGRFPGYAGHCGHWPGRLSQGEALREARPAGAAQLHPPGGHGVPRQKQSIRVFVRSYFTSEQGRQLLPALFLRRTKAAGKAPRRLVSCVLWAGEVAGQLLHILLDGQSAVHLHHGAA